MPGAWQPDPDDGLTGVYAPNDKLFEQDNISIQQQFLHDVGKGPKNSKIVE